MKKTKRLKYVVGVTIIGLLSACTVGPDYQPPDVPTLPAHFASANPNQFSEDNIEVNWWQSFKDPLLLSLIQQTIAHNYELQIAYANLAQARALYIDAGLNLLPQVSSHANYNHQMRSMSALNNRSFVPRSLSLYSVGFDAFWELDLFGRVRRNTEISNIEIQSSEANLRDIHISLIAEVARNYVELRGLQNQLAITQQQIDNQQAWLNLTDVKITHGKSNPSDRLSVLAQLESTKASIPALNSAIAQAIHRLSVLAGQMPNTLTTSLANPLPLPQIPDIIKIGNPEQLLKRRADIRLAERALASATERIGIATADLFPRVTFVGSLSLEGSALKGLVASGSESYTLGPKITWAFLDLGRVYARINAANAYEKANIANFQQTLLNALEDTENALVSYNQAHEKRNALLKSTTADDKSTQLATIRYQSGAIDLITLLENQRHLLQDKKQLAESETLIATSLIAVYKALGGGWENNDTP
jgi:multidrug efflux system outer membrane protein